MGKKIKIHQTESFTTYIVREAVEIDLDDYPELDGMDAAEIADYLEGSSCDMKAASEEEYECLSDEIVEKDILKEKITGENFSYLVEIEE